MPDESSASSAGLGTLDYLLPRGAGSRAVHAYMTFVLRQSRYKTVKDGLDHCARCGIVTHRETDGAAVCDSCTAD